MDIQENKTRLGISAVSVHRPSWILNNAWFGETMPRKFSRHTGIEARAISLEDEDIDVEDEEEPEPLSNTEQHGSGEVQYLKKIDSSVDSSNIVVMAYQNDVLRNVRRIDDNIIGIIDGKTYVFGEGKEHSKSDIEIYTIVPYKTDIRLINEKKIDIKIL